jgi:aspartate 1-decarboxylase
LIFLETAGSLLSTRFHSPVPGAYHEEAGSRCIRTSERQAGREVVRWFLRSKLHNATVTEANIDYIGSITIDVALMEAVGLEVGEKVLVVSNTSGARLETYTIAGERNSGTVQINGAAAHLIRKGEQVIVMGFELADAPLQPKVLLTGANNRAPEWLSEAG